MFWIFLSVVLILLVKSAGFRRVMAWLGGIAAAVFVVGLMAGW